jgi:hypothetical protein
MKFRPSRKLIGIASALALVLFVSNPEIFALGYLISSIGFDVFLLFLTFQLKDQFQYLLGLFFSLVGKKSPHQKLTLAYRKVLMIKIRRCRAPLQHYSATQGFGALPIHYLSAL